jgi:hypothetical protein
MKLSLFITLFLVGISGCSNEIHLRPAAITYPAHGTNLAKGRTSSLGEAIQWSVDDQEAVDNVDWSVPVPAVNK